MKITLKGVHTVWSKGKPYHYAWRGGPRIVGEPGSPEFLASYQAAHGNRRALDPSLFRSIIIDYRGSREFAKLADKTATDYRTHLAKIENEFADLPLAAFDDPRITREFLRWRDAIAATSLAEADNAWKTLMRLISWARGGGLLTYRPPERVERLYHADRADKIWREEHIAAFMAVAPEPLQRALLLALETGQRQGDLLALAWGNYDGQWIRLRQRKTGRKVNVPVTKRLRAVLENTPRTSPVILANSQGRPWLQRSFRASWLKATRDAGISDLHFHDLRGTAVTRLAEAECTEAEIATITGHTLASVHNILERYLARTDKIAIAAIRKLERTRK